MKDRQFMASSLHEAPGDHAFNGIDLFKFICAFMVCIIHVPLFQTSLFGLDRFNFYLQNCFCRIAVPFFFVSSGFLLFRKTDLYDLNTDRIKAYILKTVRLFGVWMVVLLPFGHRHLWYLSALIVAAALLSILLKKGVKIGVIAALALALYVIGLCGDAYRSLLDPLMANPVLRLPILAMDNLIPTTRNGLFFGFVYMLMGALFAHRRIVIPKVVSFFGLLVSLAGLLLEARWLRANSTPPDYNILVFLLPTVFFAFDLTAHLNLKNRPIYGRLRVIGVLVYFGHTLVHHYESIAFDFFKSATGIDPAVVDCVTMIALTFVLAVAVERLSRRPKLYWLRYLYS